MGFGAVSDPERPGTQREGGRSPGEGNRTPGEGKGTSGEAKGTPGEIRSVHDSRLFNDLHQILRPCVSGDRSQQGVSWAPSARPRVINQHLSVVLQSMVVLGAASKRPPQGRGGVPGERTRAGSIAVENIVRTNGPFVKRLLIGLEPAKLGGPPGWRWVRFIGAPGRICKR